jgi:hypothetical protein
MDVTQLILTFISGDEEGKKRLKMGQRGDVSISVEI